jgi:predicted nucleic acid-binding Zn ribbon protein
MGSYSIGEALNMLLEKSHWKPKINELRIKEEWEAIVGKTIAKYTSNIYLNKNTLYIYTQVAVLSQELSMGKEQLIKNINAYFKETVVKEIIIK